jgi:hypothetical protein
VQPQHAWDANDSTTLVYGRHTLKIGVDYRRISSKLLPSTPVVLSEFTTSAQVLSNVSAAGEVVALATSYPAYTNFAAYIQDELKVNRRLNLSAGIRWEVNPPPVSTSGPLPYIVQGDLNNPAGLTLAAENTNFWKTTYFNFAPRLGIAYQAHDGSGHETVVRAGGGVFFDSGQQGSTQAFGESVGQAAFGIYPGAGVS